MEGTKLFERFYYEEANKENFKSLSLKLAFKMQFCRFHDVM